MLSDEIVANGAPGACVDVSEMIPLIRAAQKFVLTPTFAAVADAR